MQMLVVFVAFAIVSCAAQMWKQMPGAAVDISAKGKELWVVNKKEEIYRWSGSQWNHILGAAVQVGASPDGWAWVINKHDDIYRYNAEIKVWDNIPGKLCQISAISKDRALGVNRDNNIYLWEKNTWNKLEGNATWAGIGDGDERWIVNKKQHIFRWNHQTKTWDRMPGAAVNVDVQNPCRVIATNEQNLIYIWKNNKWVRLTGAGTRSTITENLYYTVNKAEQIWMGEQVATASLEPCEYT